MQNNPFKGKSALVLDSTRAAREAQRILLANMEVTDVKPCENVPEAIRQVKARTFNIILCEYQLGNGRNGQQFLEEIRSTRLLKFSQVFFMVTAENSYEKVVSVAEHIPDDYLIKPYTTDVMEARLVQCVERKSDVRKILVALDSDDQKKALDEADRYLENPKAKYPWYVRRLRAETCLRLEDYERAAHFYEDILAERTVAWAELGLGKALYRLGEFERAKELLRHVSDTNPMYLESLDSLAKVHEAAGEDPEAQEVIGRAVEKSPLRIDRQKRLGEIALRNGDVETAEKAFWKVVSVGSGSCFHSPEAYLRLAEIHVNKGDVKKAGELLSVMDGVFQDSPESRFSLAIGKTDVFRKEGNVVEMARSFAGAVGIFEANPDVDFPKHVVMRFWVECLAFDRGDLGEKILRDVFQNTNRKDALRQTALSYCPDEPTKLKVRMLFRDFDDEIERMHERGLELAKSGKWEEAVKTATEAANRLRDNPDVQFTAAQIVLMFVEKNGWDEARYLTAKRFLERGRELSPKNQRIPLLELLVRRVKEKYGIRNEPARPKYVPKKPWEGAPLSDTAFQDVLDSIKL